MAAEAEGPPLPTATRAAGAGRHDQVALTSVGAIRDRMAASVVDAAHTTTESLSEGSRPGRAAVAIVLRDVEDGPQVLLIRRAERSGDPWSGHMAFPGGREDPGDQSLVATAIRETREELGLDLSTSGRLLGRLSDLPAVARGRRVGITIAPFVFELTNEVKLAYQPEEVAEAIWVPLDPLMHGRLLTTLEHDRDGQRTLSPAHDVDGRIVWGLTYRMLESLFALLR
jgi:8-oxo-dGTP pyrophosphatase MutT (NUDIX family)